MDGIAQALTLQPAPARTGTSSRAAGTTTSTRGSGTSRPTSQVDRHAADDRSSPAAPASSASRAVDGRRRLRLRARHRHDADELPDQPRRPARLRRRCPPSRRSRSRPTDGLDHDLLRRLRCPRTPSSSTASRSASTCADDVRLLWVLRDLLGVTGPKYGCGLDVCKACTCHINGKAFNPCSVPVSDIKPDRRDHDDRGPAGHRRQRDLHPMQEAWLDLDVAQCGYCQPGQIMAAVALVKEATRGGPRDHRRRPRRASATSAAAAPTPRIREAIEAGAAKM